MRGLWFSVAAPMLSLAFLSGCGSGLEPTVPVKGKLAYQGRGVQGVMITFCPSADRPAFSSISTADGNFSLECPVGKYKVTLASPHDLDDKQTMAAHYCDPSTTPLSVEVPQGGTDSLTLEIK